MAREPLISLDDSKACAPLRVGKKAANLANLKAKGFPVPDGFILPVEVAQITDNIRDAIVKEFQILSRLGNAVAVRSSATSEDSDSSSFAGQYESILNVHDEKSLINALERVRVSINSREALVSN